MFEASKRGINLLLKALHAPMVEINRLDVMNDSHRRAVVNDVTALCKEWKLRMPWTTRLQLQQPVHRRGGDEREPMPTLRRQDRIMAPQPLRRVLRRQRACRRA